eukprot:5232686-Prymnesium_polylepis.1
MRFEDGVVRGAGSNAGRVGRCGAPLHSPLFAPAPLRCPHLSLTHAAVLLLFRFRNSQTLI